MLCSTLMVICAKHHSFNSIKSLIVLKYAIKISSLFLFAQPFLHSEMFSAPHNVSPERQKGFRYKKNVLPLKFIWKLWTLWWVIVVLKEFSPFSAGNLFFQVIREFMARLTKPQTQSTDRKLLFCSVFGIQSTTQTVSVGTEGKKVLYPKLYKSYIISKDSFDNIFTHRFCSLREISCQPEGQSRTLTSKWGWLLVKSCQQTIWWLHSTINISIDNCLDNNFFNSYDIELQVFSN